MAAVRTGLRRTPLVGALIGSEPVQHVVSTVRAARAVRETSRFTASQLLTSRTASYELRSSGLTVHLRHRTRDVDIFKEIFGTGYAYNSYDPPPRVEALLAAPPTRSCSISAATSACSAPTCWGAGRAPG